MSSLELFQPWPADLVKDMVMYSICHVPLSKGFGYPNTLNFSMQEGCQFNEDESQIYEPAHISHQCRLWKSSSIYGVEH